MAGVRSQFKPRYNVRVNVRLKNKLTGETVIGDLVNEEEIDGRQFYVLRNERGSLLKYTKEAFTLVGNSLR